MALIVIGTACKASFPLICNLVFDYILLLWLIFSQFFALKCSETLRRLTIGPVGACRKSLQWYWSLHLTQTRSTLSFTGQKSYSVFACSVTYEGVSVRPSVGPSVGPYVGPSVTRFFYSKKTRDNVWLTCSRALGWCLAFVRDPHTQTLRHTRTYSPHTRSICNYWSRAGLVLYKMATTIAIHPGVEIKEVDQKEKISWSDHVCLGYSIPFFRGQKQN